MSRLVTFACVTAFPLSAAATVGYEEDVELHAGVQVYRLARVVPVWDRIPDGHRAALHWNAGPPPRGGDKSIRQWFLLGLDQPARTEHWLVSGATAPPRS
jgi:hypothetical protein